METATWMFEEREGRKGGGEREGKGGRERQRERQRERETCRTTVAFFSPGVAVRHLCVPSGLSRFSAGLF